MDARTTRPDDGLMETDERQTATPPGGAGAGRRLTKSPSDRVIAGVAGGLGEYFGVDAVLFRIGFVALSIAGGSGLVLYALGWLLLPEVHDNENPGERLGRWFRHKPVLAIIGTVIAINVVADGFWWRNGWGGNHDGVWGVVLVVLGVAFLLNRQHGKGTDAAPPPPGRAPPVADPATTDAADAADAPVSDIDPLLAEAAALDPMADTTSTSTIWPPSPGIGTPVRTRARPFLTPVTLSLLLVGAGAAALVGVSLQAFLALALLLVGAVMLIGSRWGRARGLLVVGLLLAATATAASVTDVSLAGGTGTRELRPIVAANVHPYRLGAGEMRLDLRDLRFEGTKAVTARVGAGHLLVIVPPDVHVSASTHVGLGNLTVFGHHEDGTSLDRTYTRDPTTETGKRLNLHLRAGVGEIDVEVR
jgi:phage shock protein PspC (stress-responsive transcriptional regulator)